MFSGFWPAGRLTDLKQKQVTHKNQMPGFGISDRFEKPSLEIEKYMSISTPGFQSPSLHAFPNKPTIQPARNIAHVVFTELTPQVIRERKIYNGLICTAGALMLSSWLSHPIHQVLQKFSPKLAQSVTQKGLERSLNGKNATPRQMKMGLAALFLHEIRRVKVRSCPWW